MENNQWPDLDTCPTFLNSQAGTAPISELEWKLTPRSVRAMMWLIHGKMEHMRRRLEHLEALLARDSSNSDQPPSSDSPFKKSPRKRRRKRPGAKRGHRGHRQQMMDPTEVIHVKPKRCSCGGRRFKQLSPFYTHQQLELPEIRMEVRHFVLYGGRCCRCGKRHKAKLSLAHRCGYGPRLTALIGEMSGIQGASRETVQEFCRSVLGIAISKGAIQKVIDRLSEAIRPHHGAIRAVAHRGEVGYVDETGWRNWGSLEWLWTMVGTRVAHFMVHPRRSAEGFEALVDQWQGVLVSDGFGVYGKWAGLRQSCLAHLIRKANSLAQRKRQDISSFGRKVGAELKRLCATARASPSVGEFRAWYARFSHLIAQNSGRKDEAGRFARRLLKEMDSLGLFLEEPDVEPTNNRAERALRFGVLWRKRSQGTKSESGDRWVERILSLRQTCRLRGMTTFSILVDAAQCHFTGQPPDLTWITQQG